MRWLYPDLNDFPIRFTTVRFIVLRLRFCAAVRINPLGRAGSRPSRLIALSLGERRTQNSHHSFAVSVCGTGKNSLMRLYIVRSAFGRHAPRRRGYSACQAFLRSHTTWRGERWDMYRTFLRSDATRRGGAGTARAGPSYITMCRGSGGDMYWAFPRSDATRRGGAGTMRAGPCSHTTHRALLHSVNERRGAERRSASGMRAADLGARMRDLIRRLRGPKWTSGRAPADRSCVSSTC